MFVFQTFGTVGKPSFYCVCLIMNEYDTILIGDSYRVKTNTEVTGNKRVPIRKQKRPEVVVL